MEQIRPEAVRKGMWVMLVWSYAGDEVCRIYGEVRVVRDDGCDFVEEGCMVNGWVKEIFSRKMSDGWCYHFGEDGVSIFLCDAKDEGYAMMLSEVL